MVKGHFQNKKNHPFNSKLTWDLVVIDKYSSVEYLDCHHSVGHISQFGPLKCRATLPAAFLFQIGPEVAYSPSLHSSDVINSCYRQVIIDWIVQVVERVVKIRHGTRYRLRVFVFCHFQAVLDHDWKKQWGHLFAKIKILWNQGKVPVSSILPTIPRFGFGGGFWSSILSSESLLLTVGTVGWIEGGGSDVSESVS